MVCVLPHKNDSVVVDDRGNMVFCNVFRQKGENPLCCIHGKSNVHQYSFSSLQLFLIFLFQSFVGAFFLISIMSLRYNQCERNFLLEEKIIFHQTSLKRKDRFNEKACHTAFHIRHFLERHLYIFSGTKPTCPYFHL